MRVGAGLLINLFLSVAGGTAVAAESAKSQPPLPEVKVEVVKALDVPIRLEYPGRTAGYREVEVRAQVSGILQQRTYQEGAPVKQGQVLFRLDSRQYQAALTRAQAALAQEQARLRQAERDLLRVRTLAAKGFASERELDNSISEFEQSRANLQAAEAEVKSRQIDLDFTTVVAPITGITSREARSEGSLIVAGDPQASLLTQLTQLDPIYVNFSLPQDSESARLRNDVANGKLANASKAELTVQVQFNDGSVYPLQGRVDFTDSLVDRATGSVSTRAVIPNPEQKLLPGQFVRVLVSGLLRLNAISVPERAVAQNAGGTYVYVIDEQGVVRQQQVTLGGTAGGRWIVESGLVSGERVVVEGGHKLQPDDRVHAATVEAMHGQGLIEEIRR